MRYKIIFLLCAICFAQHPDYRFDEGWNLIGGGSTEFPADYINTLEEIIPPVYRYNTEIDGYEEVETILPLNGYWVLSSDSFSMAEPDTCDCPPTVTDLDGNIYTTVMIGDQCWMAENLKVTRYRDGSEIANITESSEWTSTSVGGYCAYFNDSSYVDDYGYLYNWYAANDPRGLAPAGWHIPTDEELKELEMVLGMSAASADSTAIRGEGTGSAMSGGLDLWAAGELRDHESFGESGFDVLPAGQRLSSGMFRSEGQFAYIWLSDDEDDMGWRRYFNYSFTGVGRGRENKRTGYSIRCIMD